MRTGLLRIPYDRNVDLQPKQGWANIQMSIYTQLIWVKTTRCRLTQAKNENWEFFHTKTKKKNTHIGIGSFWRLSCTALMLYRWVFFMLLFRLETLAALDVPIKKHVLNGLQFKYNIK